MHNPFGTSARVLAAATLLALGACADDDLVTPPPPQSAVVELGVDLSSATAAAGERVAVAITAAAPQGVAVGGVQGYLRFDPAELRYVGQLADRSAMVIINESGAERGEIRVAAVAAHGVKDHAGAFAFEVVGPGYASSLRFVPEVIGDLSGNPLKARSDSRAEVRAGLPEPAAAVQMDYIDWALFMDPRLQKQREALRGGRFASVAGLPPTGTVYGDADLNGTINTLDAADIANTGVGNREIIIGTDAPARDRVTASNVRPNSTASCGLPGFDGTGCTARSINVLDASPVARHYVGFTEAVVGSAVPLPKGTYAAGDTVYIAAGTVITGGETRVFHSDSIYVLEGLLTVGVESSTAGSDGTLEVQPGTMVLGRNAADGGNAAVFVTRNGRLNSLGTATQPVTFSCTGVKQMGCWGGVFIAGNAVVNEAKGGLSPAPVIHDRNPAGGGNQHAGEGGAVNFGGTNDADNSGTIRYTRFLYGGKIVTVANELNNLTIGACGSGTTLEFIQVHGGQDDGLEFFGGRCNVRYLLATANDDDQLDYSFGYDGKVQFLVIQQKDLGTTGGDRGFEVDNTENSATYGTATPRTHAEVYNVTILGGTTSSEASQVASIYLRRGSSSTIRNVIVVNAANAFVFANAQTCTTFGGVSPTIDNFALLGVTTEAVYAGGISCPGVVGSNKVVAAYSNQLKDPLNLTLPDFRPVGAGVPGVSAATPPAGFFDTSATFLGGVKPVDFGGGPNVPWTAGWTYVWQGPNTI